MTPDHPTPQPNPTIASQLRLMVASSVYGFEDELDQIVATLQTYGYTVWNSHAGTMPTDSRRSNLENCLEAVRRCDVFVGLIRQCYGSGVICETSITHEEMRLALQLNKPRWVMAHENVFVARQLLRPFLPHFAPLGSPPPPGGLREWLRRRFSVPPLPPLESLRNNSVLDDCRILEMFAEMAQAGVPLRQRNAHVR